MSYWFPFVDEFDNKQIHSWPIWAWLDNHLSYANHWMISPDLRHSFLRCWAHNWANLSLSNIGSGTYTIPMDGYPGLFSFFYLSWFFSLLVRCFLYILPVYLGCTLHFLMNFNLSIHKSECWEAAVVPSIFDPLNYVQKACKAEIELGSNLF